MNSRAFAHLRRTAPRSAARSILRDIAVRSISIRGVGGRLLPLAMRYQKRVSGADAPKVVKTSVDLGSKVLVFAHFDAQAQLSAADEHALVSYRTLGYSVVVVTTARSWPDDKIDLVDALVVRENVGFDFASWSLAITTMLPMEQRHRLDHLVLVNNSVYGPLWPAADFFKAARDRANVVGATWSREFRRHLQSYFLSFDRDVIVSDAFDRYWRQDFSYASKWPVIAHGELSWEKHFRDAGFSTAAIVPLQSGLARNELTFFWRELVGSGLPYVKKSLFTHNYDEIELVGWQNDIQRLAHGFDASLIERDLNR